MLLDIRQNAFRKLHSTETTVLSLFDDLYNYLDNGQPIQQILIPLQTLMKHYPSVTYNLYADDIELHALITNSIEVYPTTRLSKRATTLANK